MKFSTFHIASVAIASGLFVAVASAQTANQQLVQACGPDVQKFCSGVQPGNGQIKACLKEHRADLSIECKKAAMAARKAGGS